MIMSSGGRASSTISGAGPTPCSANSRRDQGHSEQTDRNQRDAAPPTLDREVAETDGEKAQAEPHPVRDVAPSVLDEPRPGVAPSSSFHRSALPRIDSPSAASPHRRKDAKDALVIVKPPGLADAYWEISLRSQLGCRRHVRCRMRLTAAARSRLTMMINMIHEAGEPLMPIMSCNVCTPVPEGDSRTTGQHIGRRSMPKHTYSGTLPGSIVIPLPVGRRPPLEPLQLRARSAVSWPSVPGCHESADLTWTAVRRLAGRAVAELVPLARGRLLIMDTDEKRL